MKSKIDIGIDEKSREEIAKGLSHLLADTYTLYLKLTITTERNIAYVSNSSCYVRRTIQ